MSTESTGTRFAGLALHLAVFAASMMCGGAHSALAQNLVLVALVVFSGVGGGIALVRPQSPLGPTLLRLGRTAFIGVLLGMLARSWSGA